MGLALDEPEKNEIPSRVNGIDVLISEEVSSYADGKSVDYIKLPWGGRFTIRGGFSSC